MRGASMKQGFDKRIFTTRLLLGDLGFFMWNVPGIVGALRNKRVTRSSMEKIMAVTTAVNGCVYCSWFHARQAVGSGISEEEVRNLMRLQFQTDASEFELMALLYAQHYAETDRRPDPEMTRRLFDFYGEETARHIILVIRMIFFGNLYGNTWDAVISRFRGSPAEDSSVVFELVYFLLNFVVMVPAMILIRNDVRAAETILQ